MKNCFELKKEIHKYLKEWASLVDAEQSEMDELDYDFTDRWKQLRGRIKDLLKKLNEIVKPSETKLLCEKRDICGQFSEEKLVCTDSKSRNACPNYPYLL